MRYLTGDVSGLRNYCQLAIYIGYKRKLSKFAIYCECVEAFSDFQSDELLVILTEKGSMYTIPPQKKESDPWFRLPNLLPGFPMN